MSEHPQIQFSTEQHQHRAPEAAVPRQNGAYVELDTVDRCGERSENDYTDQRWASDHSLPTHVETETSCDGLAPKIDEQPIQYTLYRRRWFGLVVLTLMTFFGAWEGQVFSPVAISATKYFDTSLTTINWLGTVGYLIYVPVCPLVIWSGARYGPKMSMMVSAVLSILGAWVQFAGCKARSFPTVFVGQILHGIAQPFLVSTPTSYSRLWFDQRAMTMVTAAPSLAMSVGAAVGSATAPGIVESSGFSGLSLILACSVSAVSICTFLIPRKPPTPPSFIQEELALSVKESIKFLLRIKAFLLQLLAFSIFSGAFQAVSTLVNTIVYRYGFSEQEAGNAAAIMIFVGIASALIFSWAADKTHKHLLLVQIMVPLIACAYTALIFIPETQSTAGLYVVYGAIGFTSYSVLPATLEFQANVTHPVRPIYSSAVCWMVGLTSGAVYIIVINYALILKHPWEGQPAGSAFPGLIFIAGLVWLAVPPTLMTGFWIFKLPETAIKGPFA